MVDLTTGRLYEDGKHYDAKYAEYNDDVPFYVKAIGRLGGPVLELCCGTGRIAIPIAEAGHEIVGVDLSPDMIAWGEEKAGKAGVEIEWIQGDVREVRLGRKFNVVTIPFTSIGHMTDRKSLEAALETVRAHLAGDGTFILDFFNPNPAYFILDKRDKGVIAEYDDPYGDGHVTIEETNDYDKAAQINRVKWSFRRDGKEFKQIDLDIRIFYPEELLLILDHNGFDVVERYGDFDLSEFTSDSPKQVLFCKVRP